MKRQILAAAAATALLTLFGCSSSNPSDNSAAIPQPPITATDPDMAAVPPASPTLVEAAPAPAPQVAVTATPSAAGGTSYTVQPGDTLYKIARNHYGDGKAWTRIASANPQINGTFIKPGDKLVIP